MIHFCVNIIFLLENFTHSFVNACGYWLQEKNEISAANNNQRPKHTHTQYKVEREREKYKKYNIYQDSIIYIAPCSNT